MNPELSSIVEKMIYQGANPEDIQGVIANYNNTVSLNNYYQQKQVEELSLEEKLKTDPFALGEFSTETTKRAENPFLDIIGQLGDFTGLTRENIKQGWESGRARARMYDETKRIFKFGADLSDAEYQNYINLALKSGELSEIDSFKRWSDTYDSYISGGENWATSTMMAIKEEGTGGLLAVMLQSFAGLTHKEILCSCPSTV